MASDGDGHFTYEGDRRSANIFGARARDHLGAEADGLEKQMAAEAGAILDHFLATGVGAVPAGATPAAVRSRTRLREG